MSIQVRSTFVDFATSSSSRCLRASVSEPAEVSHDAQLTASLSRLDVDGNGVTGVDEQDVPMSQQDNAAPLAPQQSARCYCPVPGCVCTDPLRAAGWQSVSSMRAHLEEHACGRLSGSIPADWLATHSLGQCTVCSRLLSTRFGNACPRCRPSLTSAAPVPDGRPIPSGCPSIEEACSRKIRPKRHAPEGARALWAQCLLSAVAAVNTFNDQRAWAELFALPKMVLNADVRGGRKKQKRFDAATKQRCERWLKGQRISLWPSPVGSANQKSSKKGGADDRVKHERTMELL